MITIILAGQARVGKTTAANTIAAVAREAGLTPVILPFAKAIKDAALAAGLTKEANPNEYRAFCQNEGGGRRADEPDYWVNKFLESWKELETAEKATLDSDNLFSETIVIVDDCRYPNELAAAKKIGAITVFISRDGRILDDSNGEWRKHESEQMANDKDNNDPALKNLTGWVVRNGVAESIFIEKIKYRCQTWLEIDVLGMVDCNCVACKSLKTDDKTNDITDLYFLLQGLFDEGKGMDIEELDLPDLLEDDDDEGDEG